MVALVDEATLESLAIVANNAMNRERSLRGSNGYARDLHMDPFEWLSARARSKGAPVSWLDVCCGTGRALDEAASLAAARPPEWLRITGLDLVSSSPPRPGVECIEGSIRTWTPTTQYDLITCVHGLHYVGDK